MALDGIFLNSLINNLKDVLIDSKIDKINQPELQAVLYMRSLPASVQLPDWTFSWFTSTTSATE